LVNEPFRKVPKPEHAINEPFKKRFPKTLRKKVPK